MTLVVITQPRHPLQGTTLRVLGRLRRHGRLELLLVLPDGSKSLIPAAWTDLDDAASSSGTDGGPGKATVATLGSLADLLHAAAVISAVSAHAEDNEEQAAQK